MAVTFKSQATAPLIVLDKVAKQLLEIVGETSLKPGIFTVEKIPTTIAALQHAVTMEKAREQAAREEGKTPDRQLEDGEIWVSLEQRAWPLIEMLKASHAADQPVVWGV